VAGLPTWYQFVDWQIRWLLAANRVDAAWEVAREYQASLADDLGSLSYRLAIPYLRAFIARGIGLEQVQPLFSHALEGSVAARDYPRQLELLALRAWQELQTGQEAAAHRILSEAAALVAKTGYVRVLLDIPALAALATAEGCEEKAVAASPAAGDRLLTEQEQAVLTLLAEDRTYAQIAEALVISVNTVRTHVRHIYRKLAVHRRNQAIHQAQKLGLVRQSPG
jgi:LuxR family maltose regulon positive regulatory protein